MHESVTVRQTGTTSCSKSVASRGLIFVCLFAISAGTLSVLSRTQEMIQVVKIISQYRVHAKLVFVPVQFERSPSCILKSSCALAPTECGLRGCVQIRWYEQGVPSLSASFKTPTTDVKDALRSHWKLPVDAARDSRTRETVSQHGPPDTGHSSCKKTSVASGLLELECGRSGHILCAVVSKKFSGGNQSANLLPVFWLRSMVSDGCSHHSRLLLVFARSVASSNDFTHQ